MERTPMTTPLDAFHYQLQMLQPKPVTAPQAREAMDNLTGFMQLLMEIESEKQAQERASHAGHHSALLAGGQLHH